MDTKRLQPNHTGIAAAGELLRQGQLVAIPTETVYGLAADALNPAAVESIFAAKGRPADNPLIVHIARMEDWDGLVAEVTPQARRLAEAFWPGPLTLILPAADCVPSVVRGGLSTVAVRFPSHPVAQAVILHAGCPLAAPSANRSGSPSPTNATRVLEDMQGRIAAVLDGGDSQVGVESTVVDMCHNPPRLLRPGGVTPAMLEEVVGPIEIDPAVTRALAQGVVAASPGMKYKHYAPRANICLVKGTPASYAAYVNAHKGPGVAALCFEEDKEALDLPVVTYGSREDPLTQARELFDALRRLDEQGATTVYAASPSPKGVGLAVYNRLIRAAAFRVVNTLPVIGLTGPTGAGKTTVADTWRQLGAVVIDTDRLARQVVTPGSPCLGLLVEAFSSAVLHKDGTLNRAELARRAFATPQGQTLLNSITHPAIIALVEQELDKAADDGASLAVVDAPLLFEAEMEKMCSHVVAVIAPREQRLRRIMQRDGIDDAAARQRMTAQQPDAFYMRSGVTVLLNDGNLVNLQGKAAALWQQLKGGDPPDG